MTSLLIGVLMVGSLITMVLVLLVLFLSAALLIFARGEKKVKKETKTFMEPEKSTS